MARRPRRKGARRAKQVSPNDKLNAAAGSAPVAAARRATWPKT
jgi:hypothetical protein